MNARCIRCGKNAAIETVYCVECFEIVYSAVQHKVSMVEVDRNPVQSPWVTRASQNNLPAQTLAPRRAR